MSVSAEPLVSVVIPTRNRACLLRRTIESIWKQSGIAEEELEILVVDNQSGDGTTDLVRSLSMVSSCPLRYLRMEVDRGPAVSRNRGARDARGRFLAFVDSDVELSGDWLAKAIEALEGDRQIAAIAGKLMNSRSPGTLCSFGGGLSPIGLAWDAHEGEPETAAQEARVVLWTSSAALLLDRRAFLDAGGFDDAFFFIHEDTDLCWRLSLAGRKCLLAPQIVAHHAIPDCADNGSTRLSEEAVFHCAKNRLRSMLKNYSAASLTLFLPLYAGFTLADVALRPQRLPKLRGLWWNLTALPGTWRLRRQVQSRRSVSDRQLRLLFSPSLLPPVPLRRRSSAAAGTRRFAP